MSHARWAFQNIPKTICQDTDQATAVSSHPSAAADLQHLPQRLPGGIRICSAALPVLCCTGRKTAVSSAAAASKVEHLPQRLCGLRRNLHNGAGQTFKPG
jgi:hypothetical protein